MFGLRRKLLDKCSIVDRHMAIEILEQFKKDNKNHVATMYELMNTPDDLQREISNLSLNEDIDFQVGSETHMQSMLAALLKIDSLASRKELISELFLQLQLYRDKSMRAKSFFRVAEIQLEMQKLCATEDERKRLLLALEIGKAF
ncbi:hypothetical protein HDU84_009824 [Entophlyctis sp. JEL0112]|nr:hypothetical protein HDU84_009824 [Entophlyctis sp. JEL0112]